jgi:hypothetical protein
VSAGFAVGIDDTDMPETAGTNQLALHLVRSLAADVEGYLILRHQLLDDPRVPYTSRNGSASIAMRARRPGLSVADLAGRIGDLMLPWCPEGSDPGLCVVAGEVPDLIRDFGRRCQHELVSQDDARALAARHGIHLEGLGGTEGGVIGALAAVGLLAGGDDGRVIHFGPVCDDSYQNGGLYPVAALHALGIDEVRRDATGEVVTAGVVAFPKRLRPNRRGGRIVLFVAPAEGPGADWLALKRP